MEAKFLSKLVTEKVKEARGMFGRATWELMVPLVYQSTVANTIFVVPSGFVTDFASVPRLPFLYDIAGDTGHASAVIHDYLYRTSHLPRDVCDDVLLEALKVEGTPRWRRYLMYWGVRLGGASSKRL